MSGHRAPAVHALSTAAMRRACWRLSRRIITGRSISLSHRRSPQPHRKLTVRQPRPSRTWRARSNPARNSLFSLPSRARTRYVCVYAFMRLCARVRACVRACVRARRRERPGADRMSRRDHLWPSDSRYVSYSYSCSVWANEPLALVVAAAAACECLELQQWRFQRMRRQRLRDHRQQTRRQRSKRRCKQRAAVGGGTRQCMPLTCEHQREHNLEPLHTRRRFSLTDSS
jgi:hypothetical protein